MSDGTAPDAGETAFSDGGEGGAAQKTRLTGTWLLFNQTSTCVQVMSSVLENLTWSWYLAEVEEVGEDAAGGRVWLHVVNRACRKEATPVLMELAARIPDELLASLAPTQFQCLVDHGAGRGPADSSEIREDRDALLSGASLVCAPDLETWGVHLADPWTDPLPTDPGDPAVFDQEGDGHPGGTLVLGDHLCDMYVVQRSISVYEGEFQSEVFLAGQFASELEQNVIGGTEALCLSDNETTVNQKRNRLYWVRIDGFGAAPDLDGNGDGAISCTELDEQRDGLLAQFPIVLDSPDHEQCKQ